MGEQLRHNGDRVRVRLESDELPKASRSGRLDLLHYSCSSLTLAWPSPLDRTGLTLNVFAQAEISTYTATEIVISKGPMVAVLSNRGSSGSGSVNVPSNSSLPVATVVVDLFTVRALHGPTLFEWVGDD